MSENTTTQNQTSNQIKKYLVIVLEYWYLIIVALIFSFSYFTYQNKFSYTEYGVYSTVLLSNQGSNPERIAGGLMLSSFSNLKNEIGIIKSYGMIYRVVGAMDIKISYFKDNKIGYDPELYRNVPFVVEEDTTKPQLYYTNFKIQIEDENSFVLEIPNLEYEKLHRFGEKIENSSFNFTVFKDSNNFYVNEDNNKFYFYFNSISALTNYYMNSLNVEPQDESSILWLWLQGTNSLKNVDFINKLVEFYILDKQKEKNEVAEKTINFIDLQLHGFSDSLRKSEDKLQTYKQANPTELSDNGSMLLMEMKELDKNLKQIQIEKSFYKYILSMLEQTDIKNMTVMSPATMGIEDRVLEEFFRTLTELISEKQVLELSLRESSDLIPNRVSEQKMTNLKNNMTQHIDQVLKNIDKTHKELTAEYGEVRKRLYKLPLSERQMLQMTRQFDINNEIYTFLLQRRMEAGITLASNTSGVMVIDKALIETQQYKARKGGGNLIKYLMMSLGLVAAIIFIIEFFKNKIEDKDEVKRLTNVPVINTINFNYYKTQLPTVDNPKSHIAESFRLLRTNLQYILHASDNNIVMVSSTTSGEGKSFISSNLAAILSVTNKKTLIIGLDLRKPRVQNIFEIKDRKGVSDYLIAGITYDELIKPTSYKNLYIAPPGTIPPNPAELIGSDKMTQLLEKVQKDFDYVILDTPPIGIVSDALLLLPKISSFIYIVRQKYTNKAALKMLNEIVETNNLKNINIVLNGLKKTSVGNLKYGYGYYNTYEQGYYDNDEHENSINSKSWIKRINNIVIEKLIRLFYKK